ncbi:hypothetical protein AB0G79_11480 [Streptomyces sp. NPDC020807]|uniref:hypothetical protein n=1 Tax=Streptomyces sp. NPDC020807 TaxID=3155119 RepID=UPI0033DD2B50
MKQTMRLLAVLTTVGAALAGPVAAVHAAGAPATPTIARSGNDLTGITKALNDISRGLAQEGR